MLSIAFCYTSPATDSIGCIDEEQDQPNTIDHQVFFVRCSPLHFTSGDCCISGTVMPPHEFRFFRRRSIFPMLLKLCISTQKFTWLFSFTSPHSSPNKQDWRRDSSKGPCWVRGFDGVRPQQRTPPGWYTICTQICLADITVRPRAAAK